MLGMVLGDRYTIRRRIGAGGMGLVYLADQPEPPYEVVVKVLAPHWLHDEAAKGRFDREVQALATLRHANIVELFDYGRESDRAYLVMEYLRGIPLSRYLARTPQLPMKDFVPIAAQILKGTGYAHSRGIIVRDIKPANVMLCERRGRANFVKMLDFGLAKLVHDENPITQDQALGTLGYIAPESVAGATPDLRVDVYALGVLFYLMLSGRLPFDVQSGGSAALLYKTVNEPPVPLDTVLPAHSDVPDGFIELVHRCLAKSPNERPPDANAIVEQMIDVVPASLFRLPAASKTEGEPPDESATLSGFSRPVRNPVAAAVTEEHEPQTQRRSRGWMAVVAGVGAVGLAAGIVMSGQCDGEATPAPAIANNNDPAPAPEPEAAAALPAQPADEPAAAAPTEPPAGKAPSAVLGALTLRSDPAGATVTLDGEVVGATPYEGKTTLGTHAVKIEADGFFPWSSKLEVNPDGGEPLLVTLVRRGGGKRRGSGRPRNGGKPRPTEPSAAATTPEERPALMGGDKPDPSTLLPSKPKDSKSDALLRGDGN